MVERALHGAVEQDVARKSDPEVVKKGDRGPGGDSAVIMVAKVEE